MKHRLLALWEKRDQLFIAAVVLALTFSLGMYAQSCREAARREAQLRDDLWNFSNQVRLLSNDVNNRQAGETSGDPTERWVIQNDLAVIRRSAAAFPDIAALPQSRPYPNARHYLARLESALLGGSYADPEALSNVVTICQPLSDTHPGDSLEDTMAILEERLTSGGYQQALELLGISDSIPSTT